MKEKIKKSLSIFLFLLWNALIFHFSNQPGVVSEETSNGIINFLENIFPFLNDSTNQPFFQNLSFFVRKGAHMFLFFVLAILTYNLFRNYLKKQSWYLIFLTVLFIALSDEIHQLLIPGRSGEIKDVLIDMMGCLIAIGILTIYKRKNSIFPVTFTSS